MILLYFMLLILGFFALIKGSDMFVDGSCAVAGKLKVPNLIIGLTIVAMGTSAPELAVSLSAAQAGSNEIALSNVIGSNIANLLLILGVSALFGELTVQKNILLRDFPILIGISVFLLLEAGGEQLISGEFLNMDVADHAGMVSRWEAVVLVVIFVCYIGYLIYDAIKHPVDTDEEESESISGLKCAAFVILGLALIVGGGQAVVYSAKEIARTAGMSETLIGLTIVALGTSLPELVTSIVATKKGETDLAVGNAVGSNVFNLLMVLGVSAVVHPVSVNVASVYDLFVMIVVTTLASFFAASRRKIVQIEGATMVGIYILYLVYAQMR